MGRPVLFLVTALVILIIIAGILYYGYTHGGKKQSTSTSPIAVTKENTQGANTLQSSRSSTITSPAESLQQVVRIGTLRGGVSSLDVMLAGHLDKSSGFVIKPIYFTTTLDLANAIAHGDIDVAIIPAEFVAKLREHGTNVTIIAVDFYQNQAIIVQGKENVTSISQLHGRKIAVFKPTGTYAMFRAYMETLYGINPEKAFILVNVPPPQIVQAFARGDVDAAVIWEPFVSKLVADYGGKVLVSYRELWQKWDKHIGENGVMIVYAARTNWAEKHASLVEKLLTARSEAAKLWNTNETLAEKILEKNYGLSQEAAKLCWKRVRMETMKSLNKSLINNILAVWELAREGGYISSIPESLAEGAFWQAG